MARILGCTLTFRSIGRDAIPVTTQMRPPSGAALNAATAAGPAPITTRSKLCRVKLAIPLPLGVPELGDVAAVVVIPEIASSLKRGPPVRRRAMGGTGKHGADSL